MNKHCCLATKIFIFIFIHQVLGADKEAVDCIGQNCAKAVEGPPCFNLRTTTLDLSCHLDGKPVPCDGPMLTNTKADIQCKKLFKLPVNPGYSTVTCLPSGVWDRDLYKCSPECGVPKPKNIRITENGQSVESGEFPWHAAIYQKIRGGVGTKPKKYRICSGTIFNSKMILTAAYCFQEMDGKRPELEDFSVAFGKLNSELTVVEPNEQIIDVQRIVTNGYKAENFESDLAVVVLLRDILFSDYIKPICIDWEYKGDSKMPSGIEGKIVGWKGDEIDNSLTVISLPSISNEDCQKTLKPNLKSYLTADKFCAADKSIKAGFGGSGFAVKQDNKDNAAYYLRGMVSSHENSEDGNIFLMTNVLYHIKWLLQQEILYIFG